MHAAALGGRPTAAAPAGTFRFAEEVKLITLDPQQHTGGGISYIRPVYETLFARAPDGSVQPLLATGYKIEGLKITLTLRQGVSFSDGEAFDANAVVANLLRGAKLGILAPLKLVADATVVDDHTALVTLRGPDPSFIDELTLEPGMMIAPKAMADTALDRNPVGTGPFVYDKAASREGQLRVYTPNPQYWNPSVQGLARLEIWEIPDDTARLNALKTGQIDAGIWLSNPQAAIIDRSPGLKLVRNAGGYAYQVIISDRAGTRVRWSLSAGQFGGFAKLGSGSCRAANSAVSVSAGPAALNASSGVWPAISTLCSELQAQASDHRFAFRSVFLGSISTNLSDRNDGGDIAAQAEIAPSWRDQCDGRRGITPRSRPRP